MQRPLISVVVCTYNREKFIGNCLACLKKQALDIDFFEVLLIDNNSTDLSANIINSFIEENSILPFKYFFEENKGLSFARNRGIKEAAGTWVSYIDDDAEAAPDFLTNLKKAIEKYPDAAGFGGCVKPKYSESDEPLWMNKYIYGYIGSVDFGEHEMPFSGKMKYPIGCNMTYKKEILLQAKGFNNNLKARSDDKYIYGEVSKISSRVYYIPNMLVKHNIDKERLSFISFKTLYMKTGNEEKKRLSDRRVAKFKKLAEYLFKLGASLLLWGLYLIKLQEIKGRYIFYSRWFTLLGFIKKSVFVR
jgi:glycosyltransferase involved in cell wall biosynthesis